MVLAKGVYDSFGRMLLAKGNTLTEEYIYKLRERGYTGFYIEDEYSEGIEVEETISVELRNRSVEALRRNDIDASLEAAKDIVSQILANGTVSLDMVDLRTFDDYTYRHSVNVAVLSTVIGMGMNLNRQHLNELCTAAIFHDLGKIMIAPRILNKPGRFTKEEFKIVKEHPRLSVMLLKDRAQVPEDSMSGILFHHENEDGSGYPEGLKGEETNIYAKIIHVADVYDALVSKRPYKDPYTPSEAIEYLMGGCHILFNEKVVNSFLKCVPIYPKGTTITLSDGREGIVFENTSNPTRPRIRLRTGDIIDLGDVTKNLNVTINPTSTVETDYSNEMAALSSEEEDGRRTVLAVDNDIMNLQLVRGALERDYHVVMAKDNTEALDYLADNERPALILMSVLLDGTNGIDTIKQIQEKYDMSIPVIFLTELSDRDTIEQCLAVHAADYIVKPFRPLYILERVRAVIEGNDIITINARID